MTRSLRHFCLIALGLALAAGLLGLVASMVLRCNDCIDYHIIQCVEAGWSDEELYDAFNVALIVGGSIVIPHLRRAVALLDELSA